MNTQTNEAPADDRFANVAAQLDELLERGAISPEVFAVYAALADAALVSILDSSGHMHNGALTRIRESATPRVPLFVMPYGREDGLRASIRGHLLELADPRSAQSLAPTPDDLLTASIASDFAWFARHFLRDRGLDDYVSVMAWPQPHDGSPDVKAVDVTLTVSEHVEAVRETLSAALEHELARKFPAGRVRFQVVTA